MTEVENFTFGDFLSEMKKDNALPIKWEEQLSGGWIGSFEIDDKHFQVILLEETSISINRNYEIDIPSIKKYKIFRLDYHQILNGKRIVANTNNLGVKAGRVIGTVAHGIGSLLRKEHYNILYFMAKPHEDGSKNQRMTLYPALAKIMAKQYGGQVGHLHFEGQVLTYILDNMTFEESSQLPNKFYTELSKNYIME